MRWTQAQFEAWQAIQSAASEEFGDELCEAVDPGPESVLQGKIVAWAKEWGKPCLSFPRTSKIKRFLPPGWPDVVLLLAKGRVLWFELKKHDGRLSQEQKDMKLMFMALGHEIHLVKSYKRFLELVKEAK